MGSIFRYIADNALTPCGGVECHHCERNDVPIFAYFGCIVNPNLALNPQLATDEPDIDEICADCILSGNVRKHLVNEITNTANRYAKHKDTAIANYHGFPNIPLFLQFQDWPLCCGDWCEFIGCPTNYDESMSIPIDHAYWERGPKEWNSPYDLKPESLQEVSIFRCLDCTKLSFTWQFT